MAEPGEKYRGHSREELREMDDLAHDLVQTDFDRVVRGLWVAEKTTKTHALESDEEIVQVYPDGGGSMPIEYDRDQLEYAGKYSDVVEARGGPRGRR